MAEVKTGDTVQVHYTGKLDDGTVFDSSHSREPLEFVAGQGSVIPGFEHAVLGMSPGQNKTQHIPCEEAYGPRIDALVVELDKGEFAKHDITPAVGMELNVKQENGQTIPVRIAEVTDAKVKLDANHPLAGRALTFDIALVAIL